MDADNPLAVHLLLIRRKDNILTACGLKKFLLATVIAANVTCDECESRTK